jgi:hypothetical protein
VPSIGAKTVMLKLVPAKYNAYCTLHQSVTFQPVRVTWPRGEFRPDPASASDAATERTFADDRRRRRPQRFFQASCAVCSARRRITIWLEQRLGGVAERSNAAALKAWAARSQFATAGSRFPCKGWRSPSNPNTRERLVEGHRETFWSIVERHRYVQRHVQAPRRRVTSSRYLRSNRPRDVSGVLSATSGRYSSRNTRATSSCREATPSFS